MQPSVESVRIAETPEVTPGDHQRVLQGILGPIDVPRDTLRCLGSAPMGVPSDTPWETGGGQRSIFDRRMRVSCAPGDHYVSRTVDKDRGSRGQPTIAPPRGRSVGQERIQTDLNRRIDHHVHNDPGELATGSRGLLAVALLVLEA